jgi:hypothetical protein
MDTNFEEINLKANSTDMATALALKANLASPVLTGTPTAPTPDLGDNSTKIATTQFVNSEISNDVGVANSSLVKTALNASGDAPIYACRAWVNFNGMDTVAIRASGNVSSITDNGTGDYTVNFTTAMQDENHSVACSAMRSNYDEGLIIGPTYTASASHVRVYSINDNGNVEDSPRISVQIFR